MFAYSAESVTNQGFWLGFTEILGDYRWFETYLPRLSAVTVADIQRVAQRYLSSNHRVVGVYVPEKAG